MLGDNFFMDTATRLAQESHCISLKVGAVIVKDKRIISMGYNGTPTGCDNCDKLFNDGKFTKEEHHKWSLVNEIHAEMNALMFAAKEGIPVNGCTLYVTHQPCDQCMKNIFQSGIKRVVYGEKYRHATENTSFYSYSDLLVIEQYKK